MKRLFAVLIVFIMVLSVFACTNKAEPAATVAEQPAAEAATEVPEAAVAEKEQLTFALIHSDQGTWQTYMRDYTQVACEELGVKLLVYSGDNDGAKNISDLQTVIQMGVDAVLFTPVDTATDVKMKEMLNEAGIPFINFDRGTGDTAGQGMHIAFVGQNDEQAGYDLGKYMIEELGVTNLIQINGNMSSEPGVNRAAGLARILSEHPEVELLGAQAGDWQLDLGMNVAQDLLNAHPETQAIWCGNDDMALGALAASQTLGIKNLIIGAMDCSDAALENILAGGAFKVSVGAHFVCGPIAAISMYDYLNGMAIQPMIKFNMLKVDSTNAAKFLEINSQYGLIKGRCSELSKYLNPAASDDRWVTLLTPYA